jgi:sporulation protein YlmC with PRC-barrel domain
MWAPASAPLPASAALLARCDDEASSPEGKAAVTAETEFTIGARASCSDGYCGEVKRLVFDPATETVTHLVIQHGHRPETGRLVPAHLAETTDGEIRLHCTLAEFGKFDHAEEREIADAADQHLGDVGAVLGSGLVDSVSGDALAPVGGGFLDIGPTPPPRHRRTMIEDVVPLGEDQMRPGDPVHAVDGEIGRVRGFLVNPDDDRVTHVLLQEGHLWGREEVAIPIAAVTRVDIGIRLNLTKDQVGNLPPVD